MVRTSRFTFKRCGYGKLIGASIEGSHHFYNFLNDLTFKVGDKEIEVHTLTHPDFNMVDYVFKEKATMI